MSVRRRNFLAERIDKGRLFLTRRSPGPLLLEVAMTQALRRTIVLACVAVVILITPLPISADDAPKSSPPRMTGTLLEELIRKVATDFRSQGTVMEFSYDSTAMACVFDRAQNRMRLVASIIAVSDLSPEQTGILLEANFHTALDGRYATSDGILYAAYIHPLSMLSEKELLSGLRQVASLVTTFGTTYTSGELVFGGTTDAPQGPDA